MASRSLALVALALTLPACGPDFRIPTVRPLCGTWRSEAGVSERWDRDGKDLRGEGRVGDTSERLTLVARGRKLGHVYVAQPDGAEPTHFKPIEPSLSRYASPPIPVGATRWSWANYEHDFPQEIHYTLIEDRLEAKIAGPDGGAGARAQGWTYTRVAACGEDEP